MRKIPNGDRFRVARSSISSREHLLQAGALGVVEVTFSPPQYPSRAIDEDSVDILFARQSQRFAERRLVEIERDGSGTRVAVRNTTPHPAINEQAKEGVQPGDGGQLVVLEAR